MEVAMTRQGCLGCICAALIIGFAALPAAKASAQAAPAASAEAIAAAKASPDLVGELSKGALLERKLDRTVRQGREIIVDVVDQLVAKPPPLVCVKVKSHAGYLP